MAATADAAPKKKRPYQRFGHEPMNSLLPITHVIYNLLRNLGYITQAEVRVL
jgi:hypothetical protein